METAIIAAEERQAERETFVEFEAEQNQEQIQSTLEMAAIQDDYKVQQNEAKQNDGGCCVIM